ncbi:methionine aminotransferase [Winogradskyella immobilis]|uniref:Aminotransferase class I/II-fold pyridoxal phosphate-dependent enzyme n=1 Tax=Winogradskyella immobilis TaxID=2816852 RepID=A0ABS8EM48_9FLAO|nr:methionine aminotransferase [Winogradskyella immobilis]MCC1484299.1 aminotransferase class I/II-fold pyridoxal phosphate-dependent enzyme [Winogradskyella immobilis]MCG0016391.1 aminotransferase class I/II-fold pyridoxal phosphate-dependent enzyme [Winogradskyella immobilis]
MQYKSKLPNVSTNIFSIMSALANQHNALNLSQGFPNYPSSQKLNDLVNNAMNTGYNQYAPMPGNLDLLTAISNKYQLLYNNSYHPEKEITVTSGASQAIFTIISTFIRPNDEVIIFTPAYDCYEPAIELNGGKTITIQLSAPDYGVNWETVKSKISSKTKMIIINSPHNPSGTIWSETDMLQLQDLTKNTDIIVLSDEVYEHIIFDGEQHQSVCLFNDLKQRSFITASFGKTFHNTGWKIGYCCAPEYLMSEFRKAHQFNVFCVNHPMQKGLADYMQDSKTYTSLPNFFQQKRDLFLSLISESRFKIKPSQGTYFQVLDYSEITGEYDVDFAKRLTKDFGIASIPLSVFNENDKDDKVLRFCFAKTDETLVKATEIICKI